MKKRILILGPSLSAKGGVSLYYSVVFPLLQSQELFDIEYFSIGSSTGRGAFGDFLSFFKKIYDFDPHLLHVNTSLGWKSFLRDGFFLLVARLFNCKRLVFFRGWSLSDSVTSGFVFQCIFKLCYKSSHGFCVLANDVSNKLKEWQVSGTVFKQTTVVDENLLELELATSPEKKVKRIHALNLLFLSRVEKEKGIFELVNSLKILNEQMYDVHLTIAGAGSQIQNLKNEVIKSGIEEIVTFVGFVEGDKKRELLKNSDVFCLPSYTEGMPNSVLEAMCFGMPIIATPTGALKDIVTEETGILVPIKSIYPLVDAIKKFTNKSLLLKISEYNKIKAADLYLSSSVSQRLINVYKDLL